jgi:hypothetical protein
MGRIAMSASDLRRGAKEIRSNRIPLLFAIRDSVKKIETDGEGEERKGMRTISPDEGDKDRKVQNGRNRKACGIGKCGNSEFRRY